MLFQLFLGLYLLYLLNIFKLTFSSQGTRNQTLALLENWNDYISKLPKEVSDFDWRDFQLEYRDYLDLVKLAQLIPIIGAGVGAVANYQLANKLGLNAMQCYRLRHFDWEIWYLGTILDLYHYYNIVDLEFFYVKFAKLKFSC